MHRLRLYYNKFDYAKRVTITDTIFTTSPRQSVSLYYLGCTYICYYYFTVNKVYCSLLSKLKRGFKEDKITILKALITPVLIYAEEAVLNWKNLQS